MPTTSLTRATARVPLAPPPERVRTRSWWRAVVAVGLWIALVAIAIKWGEHVIAVGDRLRINAPPLSGDYRTRAGRVLLVPALVAVGVIGFGPRVSRALRWEALLGVAMVVAVGWAIALGLNDGWRGLTDPLVRLQYIRTVPRVHDPLTFLRTFTERLPSYNIHTQGHPPGMVLVLWTLDRVGLGGLGANLALVLAGGAASIAAVMVAVRDVADEATARAVAPFLVLAPAAIWWSSGDAFFAGVSAWAVTLVILATGAEGRRSDRLALAGGLLFGATAMLSYGLVLLAIIPVGVAIARRRFRPLVVAAIAGVGVILLFLLAGFWWFAGAAATRVQYWAGVATRRPYSYFAFGNLAAFAIAVGPAAAVGLAYLRDRRVWLLVGGALAVVVIADLSGMSKGEVERIWLPFVPWVLLATAAFAATRVRTGWVRVLLFGQAALAIAVQGAVRSPW